MEITDFLGNDLILQELGARFEQKRVAQNMTQAEMAEKCGVSIRTLTRFEKGASVQLETFVRLLKGIRQGAGLNNLIPKQVESPMRALTYKDVMQKRASKRRFIAQDSQWTWGEDK